MATGRTFPTLPLWLICVVTCVFGAQSPSNRTADLALRLGNQEVYVRFSPSVVEGLHEHKTIKVFYESESSSAVTTRPTSNPTQRGGGVVPSDHNNINPVKIHVRPEDSNVLTIEGSGEIVLFANGANSTRTAVNESFITLRGEFLGRTVLTFFVDERELGPGKHFYDFREGFYDQNANWSPEIDGAHDGVSYSAPPNSTDANTPLTHTVIYLPNTGTSDSTSENDNKNYIKVLNFEYHVSVIREHRAVDSIFLIVIVLIIILANVGMGCKIDLEVIKEVTRRPVAPTIGMCCQYIVMPLLAFGIIKLLQLQGGAALGMFAAGCAPGGGASNMYAYLLKGDVSLSVTMTFFSTMAALGLIPFWLFTLGRMILADYSEHIVIPYANIIYSLVLILVPVGIGILLQRFRPVWSKQVLRTLRPVFCFFIIFIFTFGVYVNLFVFRLFTLRLVTAGILLPYVGFVLGGGIAALCRQSWTRVKTIAVETGIQNTGVAFLVVTFTLPQPEADLSMVSPIIVATFTPFPMLIAIAIIEWNARREKRNKEVIDKNGLHSPITELDGVEGEEATFDQQTVAFNRHDSTSANNSNTVPRDKNDKNDNSANGLDSYPMIDNRDVHRAGTELS